jgi:hypothetical protein
MSISFGAGFPASDDMPFARLASSPMNAPFQGTGQAAAFQISELYCAMVRSLEKRPDPAMFNIALRAQPSESKNKWHIRESASR